MNRAFVKGDDSDLPDAGIPERAVSEAPNYVTRHGLAQLHQRYEALQDRHARLKAAQLDFDRPKLQEIERDLRYLSARLESAQLVDVSAEPKDEVHFGATVTALDHAGRKVRFTIVGEDEADVAEGKVSWNSPLAKALIGARLGDVVTWNRPAGATELEILSIGYED